MFGMWETIYLALFLFGAGFLLIQFFLGSFGDAEFDSDGFEVEADGFDGELDADTDLDAEGHSGHDGPSVSFLTPLIVTPTMAGIGILGLVGALGLGLPPLLHIPLAVVGGLGAGYALFYLLARVIAPMQGSTEVRVAELWGTVGEVTTPIPADRLGEIRFVARGSYHASAARSLTGEALARGQTIIIEEIKDSVALVRPTQ